MKNTTRRHTLQFTFAALLAAGLVACGGSSDDRPNMGVNGSGMSSFDSSALANTLDTYALQPVSAAEADGLAFMREEEQLAQAVYLANAALWPTVPVFANVAGSEATHTSAVKMLLDRYALADPLAGLAVGSFKSPLFQTLYADLVAASRVSLVGALRVGVQIEELDISDLASRAAAADNADILLVYDNLVRGSRNHLRAYMSVLVQQGGSYTPQYISQAEFDAIVSAPMEKGR
jgi:hypothetical protein